MDTQYKEFLSNIAEVVLISQQVKSSTDKEFELIQRNHQSLIENGREQHSSSLHNMAFRSLTNGKHTPYAHIALNYELRVKDLINRRNKHYLWLLVEAFEYFEHLVNLMYAHIGHKDPGAWPPRETKSETPASLATKPFEWFYDKAESNEKLGVKLNYIRKRFPALAAVEKSNYFKIDFRFTICLIGKFRHIVVHKGGRVHDFQKFVASIFNEAGIANNGNYDLQKLQQINYFIERDGSMHRIIMLEVQQQGTPFHIERLGTTINWLLAYADYIYTHLIHPTYFSSTCQTPTELPPARLMALSHTNAFKSANAP